MKSYRLPFDPVLWEIAKGSKVLVIPLLIKCVLKESTNSCTLFWPKSNSAFLPLSLFGYFGLICATHFGLSVPGISVQTVPLFTVQFVPYSFDISNPVSV